MKRKFLKLSMKLITDNKHYTDDQLEMIAYGLETIYLVITKSIIIFSLAYVLGIFKEVLILLIAYNVIRSQAFGIHASKSIYCLLSSIIFLVIGALICKYIVIPWYVMLIIAFGCDVCLLLYAPADTYKRPIINVKKRKRWKLLSFILGIIYTILIVVLKDYSIVNYLLLGMLEAVIMILPITYKIFNLPYNNYKSYHYGV